MPVAVDDMVPVRHSCGHEQEHDMSARDLSERRRFAKWLSKRQCNECWRAERRKAERTQVAAWEHRINMPPLSGSPKQLDWGARVRHDLLIAAREQWGGSDEEFSERLLEPAKTIINAGWWIDNRDADPSDLPDLLADAVATEGYENPF